MICHHDIKKFKLLFMLLGGGIKASWRFAHFSANSLEFQFICLFLLSEYVRAKLVCQTDQLV